jgi:acetolactate synthase I/II/III large subunit
MVVRYGSDLVVDYLAEMGIEYVAGSPGASFRGLHDSLIHTDNPSAPSFVECLHEEVSVAIAHGYAKAAGRPMAAAIHNLVGLQHAAMAIYNAWCDRVPMLLLGGSGPRDTTKRRPWIDWIHTASPQSLQVRDYVKWDEEPASIPALPESLIRAWRIARSAPAGPTYVALDMEVQEGALQEGTPRPPMTAFADPEPIAASAGTVERLGGWLMAAQRPVVVADRVGRSSRAFSSLVDIAELLALPVIDRETDYNKVSLNFPTQHPLNVSGMAEGYLEEADLVLFLECRDAFAVLGEAAEGRRSGRASVPRLVHVSLDHLIHRSWTAQFNRLHPADMVVAAEVDTFLEQLGAWCRRGMRPGGEDPAVGGQLELRRGRVSAAAERQRRKWRAEADAALTRRVPTWPALASVLGAVLEGADFLLANGHLGNWVHRLWALDDPSRYLGDSGGAGLGYGLGAAIGAALAARSQQRPVVNIQSDGDALYTPEALWTMARYRLPVLTVMDNNRAYNNSVEHAVQVARGRGRQDDRSMLGTSIDDPVVDFAGLATSLGVVGIGPVRSLDELPDTLRRAWSVVREEGRPVLVDVVTHRRGDSTGRREQRRSTDGEGDGGGGRS